MSCYVDEYGIKRKIDEVGSKVKSSERKTTALLESILDEFKTLSQRLDVIEQAVVDPHGPAAQSLADKHGGGKSKGTQKPARIDAVRKG